MLKPVKNILLLLLIVSASIAGRAQSSFTQLNSDAEALVERFEIKSGLLRNDIFTDLRPYYRLDISAFTAMLDSSLTDRSRVDNFNLAWLESDNLPWSSAPLSDSRKPLFKYFYTSKANFYQVHTPDFDLVVNPALYLQLGPSTLDDKPLYTNTRAAEIRGSIAKKVGFYAFVTENQMRVAQHEMDFRSTWGSYPGAHLTKTFEGGGIDFFQARGYITFSPIRQIRIQAGQDRNFIGSGFRSILLSDFATDYPFLKINTKVWKLNYQNLFMRLTDHYGYVTGTNTDRPLPAKYVAMHFLSLDLLKNLNIGFFESVTFHDNNKDGRGFDVNYLNPIIFYRSVEHQLGDPDKMMVGFNYSYLPFKGLKLYGQFALNEFRIADLRAGNGNSANKFAYQAGLRYIDAFGLSNVDVQIEYNRIRPYMYAHYTQQYDTYAVNSYSHYNQALAHPLGANLSELILKLDMQPWPRVKAGLLMIYTDYGADSSGSNWGGNIFLDYRDSEQEYDNKVGQGVGTQLLIANAWLNYQLRHNLFIELDLRYRDLQSDLAARNSKNLFVGMAIRLNLPRSAWRY